MTFEFHFQEGFTGQELTLAAGPETLAVLTLRTRLQLGLAQIETRDLAPGTVVVLRLVDPPASAELRLEAEKPFITINLVDGRLIVATTADRPGYA